MNNHGPTRCISAPLRRSSSNKEVAFVAFPGADGQPTRFLGFPVFLAPAKLARSAIMAGL